MRHRRWIVYIITNAYRLPRQRGKVGVYMLHQLRLSCVGRRYIHFISTRVYCKKMIAKKVSLKTVGIDRVSSFLFTAIDWYRSLSEQAHVSNRNDAKNHTHAGSIALKAYSPIPSPHPVPFRRPFAILETVNERAYETFRVSGSR